MSFDDPHSFLFGLNQFSTPTAHNSPQASGSLNSSNNQQNGNDEMQSQRRASALLNGLDAFGGSGDGGADVLNGGSFADQLELWTNANFSFDGPTGHALLGDEDKEKEEGDKEDEDKEEEKRAGKRARNDGNTNGLASRGKARQRDEEENDIAPSMPVDHAHDGHKEQANGQQQQQNFFAPPSRNADDSRRPGFEQQAFDASAPNARARSSSQHDSKPSRQNSAAVPTSFGSFVNAPLGGLFNAQQQQQPFPAGTPNGAAPASQNGFVGQGQQPQLDLTSLIALQQLVAQNPLAVASLGSFAGLNPQLGALGAQLNNLGALNGYNLQQLQQQMQQQQQQQQQSNGTSAPPFGSPSIQSAMQQQPPLNLGFPNSWPIFNSPMTGSMGAQVPTPSAPITNGAPQNQANGTMSVGAPAPDDDEEKRNRDRKKRNSSAAKGDGPAHHPHFERKFSFSEGNMSSDDSGGNDGKMTAKERAQMLEERAAERDQIPPLKLIDTGNPEADAEANRQAIEEDKRKRNTAASARFRVKKKQREAALEARSKELTSQLNEMREEINKLRNENQWLKGLIQVRPGGKDGVTPTPARNSTPSEALQAAQQLQALQQAVNLQQQKPVVAEPGKHQERQRDTGIRPRGVGTKADDAQAYKRDREG